MANRKSRYNLTEADYNALLERQKRVCVICQTTEKLCVDHCHRTGKVRGILCRKCNAGLGMFKDSPDLLYAAAAYLKDA